MVYNMSLETLTLIKDLINLFIIPLFVWIWYTDRKVNKLEVTIVKHQDLKDLYTKLDEIKKDIHLLSDKFITQKSCDFRHKS